MSTPTTAWKYKYNVFAPNFYFGFFSANGHFKRSYTEYKKLSLVDAIHKIFDFLSEYDLNYRPETETLSVDKKRLKEAEEFLDSHGDKFLTRDFRSSDKKQRFILDPNRSVNRGFTARIIAVPTIFAEKLD